MIGIHVRNDCIIRDWEQRVFYVLIEAFVHGELIEAE